MSSDRSTEIQPNQRLGLFLIHPELTVWLVSVCRHSAGVILPATVMHHNYSLYESSFYKQPQLTIVQQQQRAHYLHPVPEHLTLFNWPPSSRLPLNSMFHTLPWKSFTAALENREILLAEKVKWSQAYKDLLESQWEEWSYSCASSNVWLLCVKSLSGGFVSSVSWTWWLSLW